MLPLLYLFAQKLKCCIRPIYVWDKKLFVMINLAVIGAGSAGLTMARYLSAHPKLFKFVVFEQGNEVGGTWIYDEGVGDDVPCRFTNLTHRELIALADNDTIHSSMYKNLRTNLPKQVMEFPDFPFPRDCKTFPSHQDVLEYLKAYCENFQLRQFIRFETKVKNISPLLGGNDNRKGDLNVKWKVTTSDISNTETVDIYDAVVICNGHFSKPNLPSIPNIENFSGSVVHSHFYRVPEPYKNMNVVVLGGRASGRDIAIEISQVAKSVYLSHNCRHGISILPENFIEKPSIKCIGENGDIVFEDGSQVKADVIVYCTGYSFNFPFLDKSCGISVSNGRVYPLYKHLFNACFPSMSIIGVCNIICPFKLFSMQARWILNVLKKEVSFPTYDEMLADHNNELACKVKAGIPERHFHRLSGDLQWEYYKTISELGKVETIRNVVEKLYKIVAKDREVNILKYRDKEYEVINDDMFDVLQ